MNISGVESGSIVAGQDEAVKRSGEAGDGFAAALSDAVGEKGETAAETAAKHQLEAYSRPGWYADLTGGYTEVQAKLGASFEESRTGYDKLNSGDKKLYDEYYAMLDEAFHDGLDKIGVSGDTAKYYYDFIKNDDNQQLVREAVYERLESNPRAVELMRHFGITTG